MEIKGYFENISKSAEYKQLQEGIQRNVLGKSITIKGSKGSHLAFIVAAAFFKLRRPFLIVLNEREEAAYFYNDLQQILGGDLVHFFPSTANQPYQVAKTQNANVLARSEVLAALNKNKKQLVVSYPEALSEKVITHQNLEKNSLNIGVGEELSLDFIIDVLFEYKFERTNFVAEPGQFSVRGGIVDIFSFGNEFPYRIEFFGDEIETIRTFDPADQLSIAQHKGVSIIPDVNDFELVESRESLPEFLGKNSVIFFKDFIYLSELIDKYYDKAANAFESLSSETIQSPPEKLFSNSKEFHAAMRKLPIVEFGGTHFFAEIEHIAFETSPQPHFNKNFDLLIENLSKLEEDGYQLDIISESEKQLNRIKAIFQDHTVNDVAIGAKLNVDYLNYALNTGFIDHKLKAVVYTDHQIFDRYHRFKLKEGYKKSKQAISLKEITGLNKGDFVVHIDYGIGVFDGLETIDNNGKNQDAIRILYKDKDLLYVNVQSLHKISKFTGKEGKAPKINKLGTTTWKAKKAQTKKKVKEIAYDLIQLYAKRKAVKGFAYQPDGYMQRELEASFIYEDTPDQETATVAVKEDLENLFPMDRLVCGDVGFGKTEIAVRAAFKAVVNGKQVAILVPTTILALQHYRSFSERLKDFPVTVDYVNRFKSTAKQKETLQRLEEGKVDIIIGTHRIVGRDVKFKDLGLLVIDEEQKFGVAVKDKLKNFKANVDILTLTATPIPRTLQFSLMGARDLSVINTPPPNRHPVETTVIGFNEDIVRDAVRYEMDRGGQVFFIHNRVENIQEVAGVIKRLVPGARIATGHGQMDGKKLESIMLDFVDNQYDVLVATTIIESGLDIPNANTIIINQAQNFGLSDLHQMRGRVGRSNKKAFCYLVAPPLSTISTDARKRLTALEEFSDLGSGFNIAMRDLDIRGAGDLLGAEQSGFISEMGYDLYQRILDETMQELKDTEFQELYADEDKSDRTYVRDCQIETDNEILIPTNYVNSVAERLQLYKDLNSITNKAGLEKFKNKLLDRFGEIPKQTIELIHTMQLKWIAQKLGFEKVFVKNNRLRGYFIPDEDSLFFQSDIFGQILKFVQANQSICQMKEVKGKLTLSFDNVQTIEQAKDTLEMVLEEETVV